MGISTSSSPSKFLHAEAKRKQKISELSKWPFKSQNFTHVKAKIIWFAKYEELSMKIRMWKILEGNFWVFVKSTLKSPLTTKV